jgi:hypothetical protein
MFRFFNTLRSPKVRRIRFAAGSAPLRFVLTALLTCVACLLISSIGDFATSASRNGAEPAQQSWVTQSNEYAQLLSKAEEGQDCRGEFAAIEPLLALEPTFRECQQQHIRQVIQTLEKKLIQEKDNALQVDLSILIESGQRELQSQLLDQKYYLPYINLSQALLDSFRGVFRDSPSAKTKQIALTKLKQYAGVETGKPSLVTLAEQRIRDRLHQPDIYFPEKSQLDADLSSTSARLDRFQNLLEQQKIPGYENAYAQLKPQLLEYETFIRREVLPKARTDFRLPAEIYAFKLKEKGIDIPIDELIQRAHTAFKQVQQQMETLTPQVAQQKRLKAVHYRDAIQALKQEQLPADAVLGHYQQREQEIEAILRREHLVTLPKRMLKIRLANAQENASFPVPQYYPPTSAKTGQGTFILPVLQPKKDSRPYNDFTHPAVSWTLTAHEGRPGHDLQFTTIQDKGLSDARTEFAFNTANHEGWATYAEAIVQPYMPIEGRFISLQFQLLRAARAFLEPELQLGRITTADAVRVLTEDAGFSPFFADQEIKRYTTRLPGHAPGYFYGYQRLMQLRSQVETALGNQFNPQEFHDFILSQGFLSQTMLQKVVSQKFPISRTTP